MYIYISYYIVLHYKYIYIHIYIIYVYRNIFAHVTSSAMFVWFLFVSTLKAMPLEASEDRPRILCAASGAGDPRTRERQYGYGSIPINTIFHGMNIHLPAILMWTTGVQGFDTLPYHWIGFMEKKLETLIFDGKNM